MNATAPPPPDAAASKGHTLVWDPPGSSVERWTCDSCERAVLIASGGPPYGTATTSHCDRIGRTAFTAAVREKWPNMPLADVETVYRTLVAEATDRSTRLVRAVARRSYLAVEAAGMRARIGYVHLGYFSVRDETGERGYRDVPLTRYESRTRAPELPQTARGRCGECFLELPTSGADCSCVL
jgi:hypothetical protein